MAAAASEPCWQMSAKAWIDGRLVAAAAAGMFASSVLFRGPFGGRYVKCLNADFVGVHVVTVDDQRLALKIVDGMDEPSLMSLLGGCPHIVPVYGVYVVAPLFGGIHHDCGDYGYTMALAEHDLRSRIRNVLPSYKQLHAWFAQLFEALHYCHARGVVHADVKPQNVFIYPDGQGGFCAKLGDFGIALALGAGGTEDHEVCTHAYRPPEVFAKKPWGAPVDVWSMGVLVHECVNDEMAFGSHASASLEGQLCRVGGAAAYPEAGVDAPTEHTPFTAEDGPYPQFARLTNACLVADPRARATAEQCLELLAARGP